MKAKIAANAEIDFLTKGEMKEVLAAWWSEVGRGVRFRYIDGQATVAGGVWSMTIDGPRADFVWSVMRLTATGPGLVLGTDIWQVGINRPDPSRLVGTGFTRNARWDLAELVLIGGSDLSVDGVGTGGGTAVAVSGQVVELPSQLAWQLL